MTFTGPHANNDHECGFPFHGRETRISPLRCAPAAQWIEDHWPGQGAWIGADTSPSTSVDDPDSARSSISIQTTRCEDDVTVRFDQRFMHHSIKISM